MFVIVIIVLINMCFLILCNDNWGFYYILLVNILIILFCLKVCVLSLINELRFKF